MATKQGRGPGRPKGSGTLGDLVRVRVSPALRTLAEESAQARGVSPSEWWRRAALAYLAAGAPTSALDCEGDASSCRAADDDANHDQQHDDGRGK